MTLGRNGDRQLTMRDGWNIALLYLVLGLVLGYWAAKGFPTGVLL